MNKPQKIFLSGPISTRLDTYKGEFDRAAQIVADAGHIPLNPAWMPLGLQLNGRGTAYVTFRDAGGGFG